MGGEGMEREGERGREGGTERWRERSTVHTQAEG